ncbi:BZ3500_MvSof-1268-A1-R1_Chr11-3g03596 [Microbotryum saponariae]|uniref:BZ3500_MvSof-1268-A1-R1_Chr11-3g03596 protein n=1 Tax=Microbotryum saponariae TaxID=289078 RepID=A0A2X0L890_9BASI|nr:BZ3500_MvSof-1268-A1-R1_Chr11-3g03596 [Microbotryum saponariae]SDA03605.1 BZ3501_MvSof-1269-A2-R1_Chr11g03173 [Microbotryum saponariae]
MNLINGNRPWTACAYTVATLLSSKSIIRSRPATIAARLEEEGGIPTDQALNLDPQHRNRTWQAATDYMDDPFFKKIVTTVDDFDRYTLSADGALWQNDEIYGDRLCIAAGTVDGRKVRELVLERVHEMTVHTGSRKMLPEIQFLLLVLLA